MRGDKPHGATIHQLAGNSGHRPEKGMSPASPLMDIRPPKRLKGLALATWKRLAPQLVEDQMLTELSVDHFAAYCDAVADYDHARSALDEKTGSRVAKTSSGTEQQIPEVSMANRALEAMLKLGEILAIDPYARERRGKKPPAKDGSSETGPSLLTRRPSVSA